jgi:sugar lactone lactonase YvrE
MQGTLADVQFSAVTADRFALGESPVWDGEVGALYWVDIPAGAVHRQVMSTGARQDWGFGSQVGSMGLCRSGRLVVALESEVILFTPTTGAREALAVVRHRKPGMRLNDGKVGPDGAFWVGSMDASGDADPAGTLYRVAPNGEVRAVTTGFRVSNGLAWDLAGTRMYHSDSRGPWVDIYDFDPATGEASNRRRWRDLDEATGRPDGGACDVEGGYWSGGLSAGRLNRFAPDGTLLAAIDAPNLKPTMACFGGPGLTTLYLTSLTTGVDADTLSRHPLCGTVLQFEAGVAGVPVARFAD